MQSIGSRGIIHIEMGPVIVNVVLDRFGRDKDRISSVNKERFTHMVLETLRITPTII